MCVQRANPQYSDPALARANITVNKNAVPNDPQSPFVKSGIRAGAAVATARGFGTQEVGHGG